MKTPSPDLYRIIKSLSSQEKRYFKLFAKEEGDDLSYVRLFDAIDSLEFYDESKVMQILEKKGKIKNLSRVKNYLQETIFKFLEQHYSDYSVAVELQRLIQRIEILFSKRLFGLASKTIQKAEQLATKAQRNTYLLLIQHWKYQVDFENANEKNLNTYLKEGYFAEQQTIEVCKNIVEYRRLNTRLMLITSFSNVDSKAREREFKNLLADPYLKDESKAIAIPTKELYYKILGHIYFWLQDWKKCFETKKRSIELFEKFPSEEQSQLTDYILDIGTAMGALYYLGKTNELLFYKNKVERLMQDLPPKVKTARIYNAYMNVTNNYISTLVLLLDMKEALKESEKLSSDIQKYGMEDSIRIFNYHFCLICFHMGDFHKALRYSNKIINSEKNQSRLDIFNWVKVLNVLVHYELGNEDLLAPLCKSTANYLLKKEALNPVYKLLLDFISAISLAEFSESEKKKRFTELKKELDKTISDPGDKEVMYDFDIRSWIISKVEKRTLMEVLRDKAKGK